MLRLYIFLTSFEVSRVDELSPWSSRYYFINGNFDIDLETGSVFFLSAYALKWESQDFAC